MTDEKLLNILSDSNINYTGEDILNKLKEAGYEVVKINEPVPQSIYYSKQHDNFYERFNKLGMGQEFYNKWIARRMEFPHE